MNNKCPGCGSAYGITAQHVGRSFSCQKCGASLVVQADGLQIAGQQQPAQQQQQQQFHQQFQTQQPAQQQTFQTGDSFGGMDTGYASSGRKPGQPSGFVGFLTFRKMIGPIIVQVLFWLGIAYVVINGCIGIIGGISMLTSGSRFAFPGLILILVGLASIFVGPFLVRLGCEILVLTFRIHETLVDIRTEMKKDKSDNADDK